MSSGIAGLDAVRRRFAVCDTVSAKLRMHAVWQSLQSLGATDWLPETGPSERNKANSAGNCMPVFVGPSSIFGQQARSSFARAGGVNTSQRGCLESVREPMPGM